MVINHLLTGMIIQVGDFFCLFLVQLMVDLGGLGWFGFGYPD